MGTATGESYYGMLEMIYPIAFLPPPPVGMTTVPKR
jgi:hypothetical protein